MEPLRVVEIGGTAGEREEAHGRAHGPAIARLDERRMPIAAGPPCSAPFVEDRVDAPAAVVAGN